MKWGDRHHFSIPVTDWERPYPDTAALEHRNATALEVAGNQRQIRGQKPDLIVSLPRTPAPQYYEQWTLQVSGCQQSCKIRVGRNKNARFPRGKVEDCDVFSGVKPEIADVS